MTPEEQAPVRCAHFWRHPNLPDRGDGGEPIVCALDEGHDGWHGSRGGTQWVDGSEYDHVPAPEALTRAEDAERKLEEMREALTGALEVIEAYIPAKVQPFVVRDKWRALTPPASTATEETTDAACS